MATIGSKLARCLLASKHLCWKQNISYISNQLLRSLAASNHPIMFSSQATSDLCTGHMRKVAELGFKSGGKNYDEHRPSYTEESVDLIVSEIDSTSKSLTLARLRYDVLELGAGTGKMTEQLSKKLPANMKYLATEPSENFLGVLKSKGLNIDVASATADSIPLEDRSVGNVVCAQSFHWFSEKENLESIHRVLVPGGKLILIWNMKQFNHDWMSVFYEQRKEVVKKVGGSMKDVINTMEWRKDIDTSDDFKLLWNKSLPGTNFQGDLEALLANLTTGSAYNTLPVAERDIYINELRKIMKNWPGLDVNNITMPFTTEVYVYIAL